MLHNSEIYDKFFQLLSQISDAARQAFEGHFEKVATDTDTNMDAIADIIVRSTASGILIAARETIRLVHDAADVYLKSMSAIPIVSDNSRDYFRERSREVLNAFDTSKLYQGIADVHRIQFFRSTFWGRLKYSMMVAGTVVGDQFLHVPGLLEPLERKHFRHRLHLPKKSDRYLQKRSSHISTAPQRNFDFETANIPSNSPDSEHVSGETVTFQLSVDDLEFDQRLPFNEYWRFYHRLGVIVFSAVVGALYGMLHMTKWHSNRFPSSKEHLLWKISCCVGSMLLLPVGLTAITPFATEPRTEQRAYFVVLCIIAWFVFGLARLYIIWESFASLRALPVSAFEVVRWSSLISHV
jgi:hypothetical protein